MPAMPAQSAAGKGSCTGAFNRRADAPRGPPVETVPYEMPNVYQVQNEGVIAVAGEPWEEATVRSAVSVRG